MPSPKRNLLFSIMVPILAKRRHWFMPLHQRMLSFLALGSNTERQGGKEMLSLVTSAGCCFCHSGQRASNHSKEASSSYFHTSYSRYLIESVLLISHPRQAPIQAAGMRWVPGQHSCKHAAVPESWQTEQSNWDDREVIMPEEGSNSKQCAHSLAPILCSWYR